MPNHPPMLNGLIGYRSTKTTIMKKIITATLVLALVTTIIFVSCEKDTNETFKTATTCTDSAYLLADSLSCPGYNLFYVHSKNKWIAVGTGIAAIDTIVNTAYFYITYDSLPGTTPCKGVAYQNATLSCYQRK